MRQYQVDIIIKERKLIDRENILRMPLTDIAFNQSMACGEYFLRMPLTD